MMEGKLKKVKEDVVVLMDGGLTAVARAGDYIIEAGDITKEIITAEEYKKRFKKKGKSKNENK